jgi:hypothetical protein
MPFSERPYRLFDNEPPAEQRGAGLHPGPPAAGGSPAAQDAGMYQPRGDDYLQNLREAPARPEALPAPPPPPRPTHLPQPTGPSEYTMIVKGGIASPMHGSLPGPPPPFQPPAPAPAAAPGAPSKPGPRKTPIVIGLVIAVAALVVLLIVLANRGS